VLSPAAVRLNFQLLVTIDIDAFDPSIAPGTGTPSHGGFLYCALARCKHDHCGFGRH